MPEPEPVSREEAVALVGEAVNKALDEREQRNRPQPWDGTTERRATERRKKVAAQKTRRTVGGLIAYEE
jgi:hypothetical protein